MLIIKTPILSSPNTQRIPLKDNFYSFLSLEMAKRRKITIKKAKSRQQQTTITCEH